MGLGPIEVIVIGFPENRFTGTIVSEVKALIDRDIIAVVDAILIAKDAEGEVAFVEFEQGDLGEDLAELSTLLADAVHDLLSDEDVEEFAADLEPNSSAAVLVFEHTWAKPFRDAVVGAGGFVLRDIRVPGAVVDEVLAAVDAS
jgi:uncharacterized membrane protein